MIETLFIVLGAGLLLFSVFSRKLDQSPLTAPMAFMFLGLATTLLGFDLFGGGEEHAGAHDGAKKKAAGSEGSMNETFALFAELTLGLILFADAARLKITDLRRDYPVPARMLLLALPLTILIGAGIAQMMFGEATLWQAVLIAAILAPTDAALGAAIMTSEQVPQRLRETINVESGLNDGLALPAVLFASALCALGEGVAGPAQGWVAFTFQQIGFGALIGLAVGIGAGSLLMMACAKRWLAAEFQNLAVIGIALLCLAAAPMIGGNAFISAYIGGLIFGAMSRNNHRFIDFAEHEGAFFSLLIFFYFGAALLPTTIEAIFVNGSVKLALLVVVYAMLSLTVIRMAPIVLSLTGTKLTLKEKLFLGWVGPRGLASILFLVVAIEARDSFDAPIVEHVVYMTVFASIILHGVSARPLTALFTGKD